VNILLPLQRLPPLACVSWKLKAVHIVLPSPTNHSITYRVPLSIHTVSFLYLVALLSNKIELDFPFMHISHLLLYLVNARILT
jgi:hypothetical protein